MLSRPLPRSVLPVAACALLLAGCSSPALAPAASPGASPAPTQTTEEEPASPTLPPRDSVVVEGEINGAPVEVEVGPVVRDGELAVLRVATTATGAEDVNLGGALGFAFTDLGRVAPDAVRLVDAAGRTVALMAHDADGTRATEVDDLRARAGEGPATFHALFAAPSGDTTAVLIPHVGFVPDVPVVADGPVGAADVAAVIDAQPAGLVAPVRALDSYREIAGGTVRAREVGQRTTVGITTDVLFADDSADLSPDADSALAAAGAELAGVEAGELVVVGHTDDVGTPAHNADLSRRRAQAAATRLGELVDLTHFDVTVEGRGSDEPAVPGTSDEARAANRRVELVFASAKRPGTDPAVASGGAHPEAVGAVGGAAEGVVVTYREDEVRVTVESVRRVGKVLVGELRLERVGGERGTMPWPVSQTALDARGEFSPQLQFAATGVTLLAGNERVFPLDYLVSDEDDSYRHPLAELTVADPLDVGDTDTVTVVWPDIGADTVTLDLPRVALAGGLVEAGAAWRITDVPVEE
ncbi:OmpA family protein [Georgenia sp. MJ206]|uniref:OmpA family protein n=1 Tax=Georgenia wangjunii TaxID=3117730 RepID=UPI002F260EFE